MSDDSFLKDAQENVQSYLATIEKLKPSSVFSDGFIMHLKENLVDHSFHGRYSVLTLAEQTKPEDNEHNSFFYMEPSLSFYFVFSFYEVKFWLEQLAKDNYV